ncbi:MAG: hypothetical protein M3251_04210 [Thermoproteota archaeon]|nr:hypothetical protein [Thermoproteota archaeon]MDQ3888457.1 hypothetical protein [Thermoproteota archaeon]
MCADHDEKLPQFLTANFAAAKYTSDYVEIVGHESADRILSRCKNLIEEIMKL